MEARKHFGELLESVYYKDEAVTIERAGKPMVVVVKAAEYEEFEAKRRHEAKERFFAIVDRIREANAGVDPEQVEGDVAGAIARVRAKK
jgi:prevent-host-death family protein